MKRILLFLFFIPMIACVKSEFNGIKTEQSSSKYDLFAKVDSCTPTLSWSAQLDPNITYDVQVNTALVNQSSLPERGEIVFYKETIVDHSVLVTTLLKPNSFYFWSVRTRRVTGEVSAWSTYNKSTNTVVAFSNYKNLWFGIETPETCANSDAEHSLTSSTDPSANHETSYMAGRQLTDEYIKSLLEQGWGGVVLRNKAYTYKGEFNKEKFVTMQQWIRQEGKDYDYDNIHVFWLAKDSDNEMPSYGFGGFFMIMFPPGDYVLSRVLSKDYSGTRSMRVFKSVTVEKGKLLFLGDVISLIKRNLVGEARVAEPFIVFDEVGLSDVKLKYPLTAPYISQ